MSMDEKNKPYTRRVFYYETDKMGIVHHSNYIRWFEEARIDFMRRVGLDCDRQEREGILMPVTEVQCKYKSSVRFDEQVEVYSHLVYFNGVRASFKYEIYTAPEHVLAVTGESWHCFIDEGTRRPVNLRKSSPDFYRLAMTLVEGGEDKEQL
jgi:acyl-CoA thioester hydrolase